MAKTRKNLTAELLAQHESIGTATGRLKILLDSPPSDRAAYLNEVKKQAEALAEQMRNHFDFEVNCGKFDELIESFPRLAADIKRILGEHDRLGAALKAIAEKAAAGRSDDLKSDFARFDAQLRRHETKELDIIQKAHLTDISCAD